MKKMGHRKLIKDKLVPSAQQIALNRIYFEESSDIDVSKKCIDKLMVDTSRDNNFNHLQLS